MQVRKLVLKALFATIATFCSCAPLYAQQFPPASSEPSRPTGSLSPGAEPSALTVIVEQLEKRYNVEISVDPRLVAPASLRAPGKDLSLFAALSAFTRQLNHGALHRIYLDRDRVQPPPEKLAAEVRALSHLPSQGMVIEDPTHNRALFFLPEQRLPDGRDTNPLDPTGAKPLFLLSDTAAPVDGRTQAERLADLQAQQLEIMARLPASERPNPMQTGLEMVQNLLPSQRDTFLSTILQAGLQTWQGASPDTRNAMMQQFVQTAQQSKPLTRPSLPGGSADVAGDPQAQQRKEAPIPTYGKELRALLDTLAQRYRVRILLDPDLLPTTRPQLPANTSSLDQALDGIAKALNGVTWRRIYTRQPPPDSQPASSPVLGLPIRDLVAAIRTVERLPRVAFRADSLLSRDSVTLRPDISVSSSFTGDLTKLRFLARPTYVFYTLREGGGNPSDAKQLAELQRRQSDLLQEMSAEEMAGVMIGEIEQFQSGDADTRTARMRLPMMAAMMATWFPRKAQEDRAAPP